ncbi:GNAT family N-acetyltransferase [Nocardioides bruguierae]|uniref:GNAT family N-acetyltransferase n=1 Tax=Nocardioides bruguierae TaxID=2945102 RepID=UPI002021CCCF|nr:GNAT family N-acetyltransferase [Nocardioides bruguierae]MCL8026554.1 GNAT family N-acetyltransferase [Nocardioides bruguierae]
MSRVPLVPTAHLEAGVRDGARRLCVQAFDGSFSSEDWTHALGGLHAVLLHGGWSEGGSGGRSQGGGRAGEGRREPVAPVVAHGALVARRFLHGPPGRERSLRVGYVEAVAVASDLRRRGLASRVMESLESLAPGHDLLALSASAQARALYLARGWTPWAGPTAVLTPSGVQATPDEDDGVLLLPGTLDPAALDRAHPLVCDWRDGDVW